MGSPQGVLASLAPLPPPTPWQSFGPEVSFVWNALAPSALGSFNSTGLFLDTVLPAMSLLLPSPQIPGATFPLALPILHPT